MLRGVGFTAGSGDGLGEHPVTNDGVFLFAVVVFDRAQGSGELHEFATLAGQ